MRGILIFFILVFCERFDIFMFSFQFFFRNLLACVPNASMNKCHPRHSACAIRVIQLAHVTSPIDEIWLFVVLLDMLSFLPHGVVHVDVLWSFVFLFFSLMTAKVYYYSLCCLIFNFSLHSFNFIFHSYSFYKSFFFQFNYSIKIFHMFFFISIFILLIYYFILIFFLNRFFNLLFQF